MYITFLSNNLAPKAYNVKSGFIIARSVGLLKNTITSNSGVRKWKHILDHQGWIQKLLKTKENHRNNYFPIN